VAGGTGSDKMSGPTRSLLFTLVLCVVCSLLLTGAATGLKDRQQRNMRADRQKNLLQSVGLVASDQRLSADEIQRRYDAQIRQVWLDEAGRIVSEADRQPADLPLYLYVKDDCVEAYILPIDAPGLWGQINGYLALESDGSTVAGFTVYRHQETPGLGGEIEERWFQKNFVGKRITNRGGEFVSVRIARGKASEVVAPERQANYVDGISGATLTGKFLSSGLETVLTRYEPVAVNFRQNPTCPAALPGAGG
jgi:Na+-transporting NADH:ubiquinone oxidoreductase subunit C